jgi:hypothetical protein
MDALLRALEQQLAAMSAADRTLTITSIGAILQGTRELKGRLHFGAAVALKAIGSLSIFLQTGRSMSELMTKLARQAREIGPHVAALFSSVS